MVDCALRFVEFKKRIATASEAEMKPGWKERKQAAAEKLHCVGDLRRIILDGWSVRHSLRFGDGTIVVLTVDRCA